MQFYRSNVHFWSKNLWFLLECFFSIFFFKFLPWFWNIHTYIITWFFTFLILWQDFLETLEMLKNWIPKEFLYFDQRLSFTMKKTKTVEFYYLYVLISHIPITLRCFSTKQSHYSAKVLQKSQNHIKTFKKVQSGNYDTITTLTK